MSWILFWRSWKQIKKGMCWKYLEFRFRLNELALCSIRFWRKKRQFLSIVMQRSTSKETTSQKRTWRITWFIKIFKQRQRKIRNTKNLLSTFSNFSKNSVWRFLIPIIIFPRILLPFPKISSLFSTKVSNWGPPFSKSILYIRFWTNKKKGKFRYQNGMNVWIW